MYERKQLAGVQGRQPQAGNGDRNLGLRGALQLCESARARASARRLPRITAVSGGKRCRSSRGIKRPGGTAATFESRLHRADDLRSYKGQSNDWSYFAAVLLLQL